VRHTLPTMASQTLTRTSALMTDNAGQVADPLAQLGAASGAIGFVLAIAAIVVGSTTGVAAANPGASAQEVAQAYGTVATPVVWVGALLQILALVSLFGFATYVGTGLLPQRAGADWLRGLATGAGQGFVVLVLAGFAIGSVVRFRAGSGLDISAALALFDIHVALYIASWVLGSVFMAAAAVIGLRSRALPVWLSIAAALAAAISLAAVILPTTPVATFPTLLIWLWTVSASVAFVLRERRLVSARV
jgi:hypothetical protein